MPKFVTILVISVEFLSVWPAIVNCSKNLDLTDLNIKSLKQNHLAYGKRCAHELIESYFPSCFSHCAYIKGKIAGHVSDIYSF